MVRSYSQMMPSNNTLTVFISKNLSALKKNQQNYKMNNLLQPSLQDLTPPKRLIK